MAGPSEFKKYMDNLHSGLFEKVFERQSVGLSFVSFETIADKRIKDLGDVDDARGTEELVGLKAGRSSIRGATVSSIGLTGEGRIALPSKTVSTAAFASEFMPIIGVNTPGQAQGITLAWDQLRSRNLMGRMAPAMGPGQAAAPTVAISGLFSKFFGDVAFEGGKNLANISQAIEQARASGQATGGMKFLSRAASAIVEEAGVQTVGDLNKAQQMQVIFTAAADKAMQDKAGLEFFKQYLVNSGVSGINTSSRALWNALDPHGINQIRSISGRARGMAYFSPANVGRGSMDQSTFLRKVGKVYGSDYANLLGDFIGWSVKNSSGGVNAADASRVAFAMSHTGGIYMGQHGFDDTFMGIAAERIGSGLPKGAGGQMPQGFQMIGDKLASVRRTAVEGDEIKTATEIFFRHMREGMQGPGGIGFGPGQIQSAIKSGHRQAMEQIKNIRTPLTSRGKHALYGGVYDTGSIVAPGAFKHFNSLTNALVSTSMNMNTPADYYSRIIQALEKDLVEIGGQGFTQSMARDAIAQLETIGAEGLAGIKGTNLIEGILPNAYMSQFFLPGQLMTQKALQKGLYQRRGVEEIREIKRIRNIQSSRRLLGMAPIAHTISSTVGNSEARMAMGRVVDSALGRSLGLAGSSFKHRGMKPVVTLPLMATVLDAEGMSPSGARLSKEIFGDAGAVYSGSGQVFAGMRRQLPAQEVFATQQQLEQFLIGASGDDPRVRAKLAKLRAGRVPTGKVFFSEDNPLKLREQGFQLDIGADLKGQRMTLQAPRGAGFITGFQLPSASRAGMDPIKIFYDTPSSTPSHVSLAINDVRMTARAAPEGPLNRLLGIDKSGRQALGRLGDVVASAADLSKYGRSAEWTHRIGLLGFDPTRQTTAGSASLRSGLSKGYEARVSIFRELMEKDTSGLVRKVTTGPDAELVPGRGYTAATGAQDFNAASSRVLRQMGYTEAQIQGRMWGKGSAIGGGMAQLQLTNAPGYDKMGGRWGLLETASKGGSIAGLEAEERGLLNLFAATKNRNIWSMVTAANFRAGETEELRGTFRVRLNALATYAETLPNYLKGVKGAGMTLAEHPALRIQAEYLSEAAHYGGIINMEGRLASQMINVKHSGLKGIVNLFRGLASKYSDTEIGARQLAKDSGWEVLSLKQAAKKYGQVKGQMFAFGGGAVPAEEVLKSALLDPAVNKGFYVDLAGTGGPGAVNLAGKVQGKGPQAARYLPIPAAEELRRMAGKGLRPGQVWRPQSDTVLDAAFRIVSHAQLDPTRSIDTVTQDASILYNALARMGGKEGFLSQDVFSRAGLPGAGSARLLPNVAGASQVVAGKAGQLTAADYTASIGKEGIRKLVKDPKAAGEIIERLTTGGEAFAFVQPTPLHGAAQAKVVRLKLDNTLKAGAGGAELGLGSFLTWAMERDNDKDNAFIHVLNKEQMKRVQHLQKEGKVLGLADVINQQMLADTETAKIFQKAVLAEAKAGEIFKHGKLVTSMEDAVTSVRALASFGTFAATPFTGLLKTKGLLDQIARGDAAFFQRSDILEMFKTRMDEGTLQKIITTTEKQLSGNISMVQGLQEFAALHLPIFQGGISKEGTKVEAFINDFLGTQSRMLELAREGKSQDEIFKYAHEKFTGYFSQFSESELKPTVQRIIEASGDLATERIDYVDEIARTHAAMYTTAAYVRGVHMKEGRAAQELLSLAERESLNLPAPGGGYRDPAHKALRAREGSLEDIYRLLIGDEQILGMSSDLPTSQAAAAFDDAMDVVKHSSSEIMEWAVRNWRIVGGVGLGIAAVRAAGGLFAGDEMPAPSFSSARSLQFPQSNLAPAMIPRENDPGVQFQQAGFNRQRALVQPSSSQYSMSSIQGTAGSVNIDSIGTSVAANVRNFSNPHVNMSIRDSRSYSSNWEMQSAANQRDRSSFIHPYMGDLA